MDTCDMIVYILPVLTGLGGFLGKMILDYYWLKSPRLEFSHNIKDAMNGTRKIPNSDLTEFAFIIHMQISNNSSHDAYSFSFTKIDYTHQGQGQIDFHLLTPTESFTVKSGDKILYKIKFTYKLIVSNDDFRTHAKTYLKKLNLTYTLKYQYKNALGKQYEKSITKILSNDYEDAVGISF